MVTEISVLQLNFHHSCKSNGDKKILSILWKICKNLFKFIKEIAASKILFYKNSLSETQAISCHQHNNSTKRKKERNLFLPKALLQARHWQVENYQQLNCPKKKNINLLQNPKKSEYKPSTESKKEEYKVPQYKKEAEPTEEEPYIK